MCLWQLIGDCCLCLNDVAYDIVRYSVISHTHSLVSVRPRVPVVLLGDKEGESQTINKEQLLQIGTRFVLFKIFILFDFIFRAYGQALQLCGGESPYLLHNLAVNYYYLGKVKLTTPTYFEYYF